MVNPLSLTAAKAAYEYGGAWHEALKEYLDGNFVFAKEFLSRELPEAVMYIPEATYLAWLDFRALGMSDEALWHFMRHEAKVATDNGVMFGLNGEGRGFQRLNFACPRSQLSEALNRIADALDTRSLYNN